MKRQKSFLTQGALILASALLLLGSCTGRPNKVLSEKKMAEVLADMSLSEAYSRRPTEMPADSLRRLLRQSVLKKHDVTQEEFDSTLNWYGHHIEDYSKLYDKVGEILDSKEKKLIAGSDAVVTSDKDNLWQLPTMISIGPGDVRNGFSFSLPGDIVNPGETLDWKLNMSRVSNGGSLVLAIEYTDFETAISRRSISSNGMTSVAVTADSNRKPRRVIGYLHLNDTPYERVFADSIMLRTLTPSETKNLNRSMYQMQREVSLSH